MPPRDTAERLARASVDRSHNMLIPWYLMTSWLYYQRDISLIPDELFDSWCKLLNDELSSLSHPHKHLIDPVALEAGTGFHLADEDYPQITKRAALRLARRFKHDVE